MVVEEEFFDQNFVVVTVEWIVVEESAVELELVVKELVGQGLVDWLVVEEFVEYLVVVETIVELMLVVEVN